MSVISGLHPAGSNISTLGASSQTEVLPRTVEPNSVFQPVDKLESVNPTRNPAQERLFDEQQLEVQNLVYQREQIASNAQKAQQQQTAVAASDGENSPDQSLESNSASAEGDQQADAAQQQQNKNEYQAQRERAQQQADLQEIQQLADRDREVRAHEQAHKAVGGQYAGQMSFDYTTGPDGRRYAVAGEVQIDISTISSDPQATIDKMEQIKQAALAPAEPSSQDRRVAAEASRIQSLALQELVRTQQQEQSEKSREQDESDAVNESEQSAPAQDAIKASEESAADNSIDSDFGAINDINDVQESIEQILVNADSINSQFANIDIFKQEAEKLGRSLDLLV